MIDDYHDAHVPPIAEEPEPTAKAYYDMLAAAQQPLHEHKELCKMDAIAQIMAIKTQISLSRECFDVMI
jgi:hypothetical protein